MKEQAFTVNYMVYVVIIYFDVPYNKHYRFKFYDNWENVYVMKVKVCEDPVPTTDTEIAD